MTNYFGWQPSLLAHDLTNMSFSAPMSAMNVHMNQDWADMQARSTLYMTPTMNFNNFTPYGMPSGGMDFLLNPNFTMAQCQWNNQNNGWGNFNGGFNMNNPWGNFGWNGGNTSGTGSAATPEERAYQKKYNKLLSLVKQLASDASKLPPARKEALDEIAKHPVGKTYEEKFNSLKAEYDKVSKTEIKKFLASNASIRFGIDGKDTTEANSFYGKLQGVGYEFTNSKVDGEITKLYDVISGIKDAQENYNISDWFGNAAHYDILDVISSWNTQKKDGAAHEKRIITLIKKGYDALPSGDAGEGARNSVKTGVIRPIVDGLIARARGLKENLDPTSQAKMQTAITNLEKAYNNTKMTVDPNMSQAFDDLYVLTRMAAIAQLRAEIKESYGAIDPELFNDELFEAETIADLKAEGFTDAKINSATVVVQTPEDSGIFTSKIDETKSAREQLNAITGSDNALTKATGVTGVTGVTEAWIDNNSGKVYVLTQDADGEDEIHELTDAKVSDGKVTGGTMGGIVTATDIATKSYEAKAEKEAEEVEKAAVKELIKNTDIMTKQTTQATIDSKKYDVYKETKGDQREFVLIDGILYEYKDKTKGDKVSVSDIENNYNTEVQKEEQLAATEKYNLDDTAIVNANKIGEAMQDCLHGYTSKSDWKEFMENLDKVDATTVMHVIAGFNAEGEGLFVDSDRFFTQLMSEDYNSEELEDIKATVLKYVKEYVNDNFDKLDPNKQERVQTLLTKLDSPESNEKLDDTVESLISIFKTADKNQSGFTKGVVGVANSIATCTAAGAGIGACCGGIGAIPGAIGGAIVGAVVGIGKWIFG